MVGIAAPATIMFEASLTVRHAWNLGIRGTLSRDVCFCDVESSLQWLARASLEKEADFMFGVHDSSMGSMARLVYTFLRKQHDELVDDKL